MAKRVCVCCGERYASYETVSNKDSKKRKHRAGRDDHTLCRKCFKAELDRNLTGYRWMGRQRFKMAQRWAEDVEDYKKEVEERKEVVRDV